MPLSLRRRRRPAPPTPRRALDRSALLLELEVSVPAPERIVRWDTATRPCPVCTDNVARTAPRCRHCGHVLEAAVSV